MLIYILKFSACLAVFIVFYKLFLEKENMHLFKRFYLIFVIIIALGIPFITFTQYTEASPKIQPQILDNISIDTITQTNNWPTVLWTIYGLGVIVFGALFLKNLIQIVFKINQNTKVKNRHYTNVLLRNLVIPHTFFNYIFLNKHKFETKQIPKEVLLHEETHAFQKHSFDILFIEILQVIFWFNPLLYFIKKDIKLNHEFLADQAVLNNGFDTSTYQNTLLTFSSPDSYWDVKTHQLANAINYSLIKKRFTVMKTQTSKKGIWLRSLLLLPLLAILLFSFSTRVVILEKKTNGTEQELTIIQEKASAKQIAEYNTLAKKYNDMPEDDMIIRKKDLKRLKSLYGLMSSEQKKNAEPFPNIPAPPATDALDSPKVIEGEIIPSPSPDPLPDNATPAQNKKYKEAIKDYKLKTQKVELQKIKERELIKVRKIKDEKAAVILKYVEEKKQLKTEQRAYKEAQVLKLKAQKGELVKVREVRSVEDRKKLLAEKRTYKETQVAAKVLKLKAQKGELVKVREVRIAQDKERVKEAKKVYIKAKALNEEVEVEKAKAEKEELIRIWEKEAKEQKELKNKIYKQLKSKVKDQKKYTEEEINKMAKAEKKAYKKAQRKEKAQKKKSDKNENE